ncbi:MAG: thioredoxin family protein [Thermoanaerobaculia bacterium]
MTRTHRFSTFVLLAALGLFPAGRGFAQGVPSDSLFSGFQASGDWAADIGGKPANQAEIYYSERAKSILVMDAALPSPVLVNVAGRTVETLDLMKVAKQPNGSVDLLADAVLAPQGSFTVDGDGQSMTVSFKIGDLPMSLRPKPWLLGSHPGADLLAYNPEYARGAYVYQPDPAAMKVLKAQKGKIRVRTFFGSWCPHCKKHVPMLLKVMQGLAGSAIQFEFYGLPSPLNQDPEAVKNDIQGVPTGIVYIDGKEVGRIPNSEWANPEIGLEHVIENARAAGDKKPAGKS